MVLDLEKRFHLERKKKVNQSHIIVTEINNNRFGLSVDSVKEILKVSPKEIQKTPDLIATKINADYLKGVVVLQKKKQGSRLVILLDIQKLLQEKELLSIEKTFKIKNNQKNT